MVDITYESTLLGGPRISWSEAQELFDYEVAMIQSATKKIRELEGRALKGEAVEGEESPPSSGGISPKAIEQIRRRREGRR